MDIKLKRSLSNYDRLIRLCKLILGSFEISVLRTLNKNKNWHISSLFQLQHSSRENNEEHASLNQGGLF